MEGKNFDHPVYEHPDTEKVINPITENWISQKYARQIDVLADAKEKTARYFRDLDEKAQEAAEKAEEKILKAEGEDEEGLISSSDEDEEVLEETDRVEFDETGTEKRVDHGDSASERTPDEALESIMSDLDDDNDLEGEDFVDADAEPSIPDQSIDAESISGVDDDVEEFDPDNVDMPTFPGGVYSTKSRNEKKKRKKMQEMNNAEDPRDRNDTKKAGGPNKRYEHNRDTGGIRVINENKNDGEE